MHGALNCLTRPVCRLLQRGGCEFKFVVFFWQSGGGGGSGAGVRDGGGGNLKKILILRPKLGV